MTGERGDVAGGGGSSAGGGTVVVIGGGIAGCAVAVELAERGVPVTLVERDQPGVGATGASAGMLAPQYESAGPDALFRFALRAREAWPDFAERLGRLSRCDAGLRTDGMLVANRGPGEEEGARAALVYQHEAGLRGEVLSPSEARARHGGLDPGVPSWLWLPDEAQVDAQRLAVALADAVRGSGARLVVGRSVEAVESEGGRVTGVRLQGGATVAARRVVVAAGAWSDSVEGLPREVPVRPVRGQMLRLLPVDPVPWTLVADHQAHYLVPRVDGTVLVGSTMEDAGFDDSVTEEGRDVLAEAAHRLVPALDGARVVERWSGLRPISSDRAPVLGPDPDLEGLFYATGAGRNGILFAPLVGRAVADLANSGESELPWQPFSVGRFGAGASTPA